MTSDGAKAGHYSVHFFGNVSAGVFVDLRPTFRHE